MRISEIDMELQLSWLNALDGDLKISQPHPYQTLDKAKWGTRSRPTDSASEWTKAEKEGDWINVSKGTSFGMK